MAIAIRLSKSEDGAPWGFRLVGGVDFEQPVVVVKVNPDSLAETAGLEVGDIIVRINDNSTAGLTHNEVHDLLLSAGLEFELGIRRGEIPVRIFSDEDYDIEESNAIRQAIEEEVLNEAITRINNMKNSLDSARETSHPIIEDLSGQEEIINTVTLQSTSDVKKGQKWSTFLVKPEKPLPKLKKKVEEKPKDEPYRVVITKQTRRPSREKKVQFDQNVTEVEVDFENDETEDSRELDPDTIEVEVKVTEDEEITVEEIEGDLDYETEPNEEEVPREDSGTPSIRDSIDIERERLESFRSIEEVEITPSLEEQLLAVQKQLQALSQLPSAIQLTLDAVSKQLASIVGARESAERNGDQREQTSSSKEEEDEPQTEEEFLEDTSLSEKAEAEVLREDSEANSIIGEDLEDDDVKVEKDVGVENEEVEEREPSPYAGLTEEEREAQIKKEELEVKKQKTMEDRTSRPIQRPIILPGGRKWSIPEDAIPSYRKPKMSDEKIIETIESNLEVIIGNRKGLTIGTTFGHGLIRSSQSTGIVDTCGNRNVTLCCDGEVKESNCWKVPSRAVATKHINFLKYEPPAKNLDYLQRSEVYRLVHDMEPPVRGITSRAEKVLAEQDYYEATQEAP